MRLSLSVSLLTLSVVASVVSAYTPAFEYKHYPAGCVDGNNMKLVPGKTILEVSVVHVSCSFSHHTQSSGVLRKKKRGGG